VGKKSIHVPRTHIIKITMVEQAATTGTTMTAEAVGNLKIIKAFAYVNDITPTIL
jgi:hypothetical protein